jgi:hypothetical protein
MSDLRGSDVLNELRSNRQLSIVEDVDGLIGYRFAGPLHDLYEFIDHALVVVLTAHRPAIAHSCAVMLERDVLERISFFEKLPSIPFETVPHGPPVRTAPGRVLSPSTCYNTFAHLAGETAEWELAAYTARGRCHRFEPADPTPLRMSAFDMRELVLIGRADAVTTACEEIFLAAVAFLRAIDDGISVAGASDVFYGADAAATRSLQLALGLKREVRLPGEHGANVAVGSRNLHQITLTRAFDIGPSGGGSELHSACVAFGLDRLLLLLLARTPELSVKDLMARIESAAAGVSADCRELHRSVI